ncbi:amidohydrolase family protein [Phenylobacterium sp.]|jgi:predicted TIM-barrel fold metal-dependent hydrolase|uniref:amidohydrolase family protein n=1 Tax=Phenylobacterium sp. TaxID=1871053 RepID=UPI002F41054B
MSYGPVVDADAHFIEPAETWSAKYLDQRYASAVPRRVVDSRGRTRRMVGDKLLPYIPLPPGKKPERLPGAADPAARLADMDRAGVDVMVIYPTAGLYFFSLEDKDACVAMCRAYNDWAADFCAHDPRRLVAPAVIPQMDVQAAIAEARRGAGIGLKGAFMRPNPIGGRTLEHPAYEPLWAVLAENNVPVVLHEGTTQDLPQVGLDRYDNFLFRHMVSHPFEQQMGLLSLIMGGVLERHPNLRAMIVECGVGWAPYWLDRMDDHAHHWGHASAPLALKPSEYFKRQVFVGAEGDERLLPFTVEAIGDDNLCFSTDYPHPDHDFDGVVDGLKAMKGLSEESKRKILGANAARLFGLDLSWWKAPRIAAE